MRIPLFPLQTVFFPGETVPLHIFEERYKALIADCLQEAMTFGIPVYIDKRVSFGTEVQLKEVVNTYADGSMDVVCVARQAFRIGPATTATPGLFDGLAALSDRFGSLPMAEILEPIVQGNSIVRIDNRRNLLILAGTGQELNYILDTIEVASTWDLVVPLYERVTKSLSEVEGILLGTGHSSHSYRSGTNLYFTFAARPEQRKGGRDLFPCGP